MAVAVVNLKVNPSSLVAGSNDVTISFDALVDSGTDNPVTILATLEAGPPLTFDDDGKGNKNTKTYEWKQPFPVVNKDTIKKQVAITVAVASPIPAICQIGFLFTTAKGATLKKTSFFNY